MWAIEVSNAVMVSIGAQYGDASSSGFHECRAQALLVIPRKKMLVIFDESIVLVTYSVWRVGENQVAGTS